MNLAEWLLRTARLGPGRPALLTGERVVADYRAFAGSAARIAGALRERFSITPGDRVALLMPNQPSYLELLYAVWFAGAAVVPINYKLHPREAAWIIENAGAKLVFASEEMCTALEACLPSPSRLITVEKRRVSARSVNPSRWPALFRADAMTSPGYSTLRALRASRKA